MAYATRIAPDWQKGLWFDIIVLTLKQTGFERNDLSNPPGKEDRSLSASPSEEAA